MALLDWVAGLIPAINRLRGAFPAVPFVTAYLNTTFARPVRTPGTLLLTAEMVRMEGRKVFVTAKVLDEHNEVLAKADVLFVETRPASL